MNLEERIAQLSPTKLALLELKLKNNKPDSRPKPQTEDAEPSEYAPLSFSQERLWFLTQLEPDSCIYNLPAILPWRGPVNSRLVEASLQQVAAKHSALRTRFVIRDDQPRQLIEKDASKALDFSVVDLRDATDPRDLSAVVNDEIWVPFDLAAGPLWRVRLILQHNNDNLLLVVMHHIISDGWSINIFTREFRLLYEAAHSGRVASLPPLPLQYVDYSRSQRQSLEGEMLASLLNYWRAQLQGAPSLLALPLDHPRPARQSFKGALHQFTVSWSSLQEVKSLCSECGVVPFMVLLSVFKVLLFRYVHEPKIVVGTPIANRNYSDLEQIIGFFTNTLVLCSSLTSGMSFRELLGQVRQTTLGAYEHQQLPFEKLVSELQPERSLSHNPLFQVMFIFQNLPTEKLNAKEKARANELSVQALSLDVKVSKFDLTLAMTETDDGLSATFEYATDLFEADSIERMAAHFVNILEYVVKKPDEPIAGFCFLSPSERELILDQWNDTGREWSEILPLHARFEKWVEETPDAKALIFADASLSYKELDRRAGLVARLLRRGGIERGSVVGICLSRSLEMVIGLFAILKAGAAYMPIDPEFPEERIAYMLGDAKVDRVLTTSECLPIVSRHGIDAVALDELDFDAADDDSPSLPVSLIPTDLAYVLFTSGSTGTPKGVMVSHGAIYNRLQWMQERYNLTTNDRVMQKTPFTFDVSVWEFFWPLSEGACLVVAEPDRHKESAYLVDLIGKQRVTCLHFVPSMLQLFLHEDLSGCDSLTRIICSGEALTVDQCRRLQALPGVSGHNLYGPTEAAVDVTHWDCDEWRDQYLSVPIGRPIANTQIYILNEKLQPSPIGVPGELYIGGHNLAEGYLNKPELTEQRFIPDPFAKNPGARLYKTGDLARFRGDGNIEYLSRIDTQIKLRGLRIELGEIESLLRQYPGIAEASVIVHRFADHDERLAAYVVLDNPGIPVALSAVGAFLGKKLPNYMIPSTITTIPELPLTANGKLDRKRLPEPAIVKTSEPAESVSNIEKELLAIWRRFLKADALKTDDDFFASGGHSILVTRVINSINNHYHLNVPVRLLFENPTVKTMAKALTEFEGKEWLADSKTATALLTHSNLRVQQTLDDLSEEQIDEFLEQHLDDPAMARFNDATSLLAWSRSYSLSNGDASRTASGTVTSPPDFGSQALDSVYMSCYAELARTKAAIDGIRYGSLLLVPPPVNVDDLVARLQEQGTRIFEDYAREIRHRISGEGAAPMAPAELHNYCSQMMSIASLAASIRPSRVGEGQSGNR